MCGGVQFVRDNKIIKSYFPNPKAVLPVLKKGGEVEYVAWGNRENQHSVFPRGGWARHESIMKGVWDQWFPKPVKIVVSDFSEKDKATGVSEWFPLTEMQFIQGLIARYEGEQRVYVVTIEPTFDGAIHDRWPRILNYNRVEI